MGGLRPCLPFPTSQCCSEDEMKDSLWLCFGNAIHVAAAANETTRWRGYCGKMEPNLGKLIGFGQVEREKRTCYRRGNKLSEGADRRNVGHVLAALSVTSSWSEKVWVMMCSEQEIAVVRVWRALKAPSLSFSYLSYFNRIFDSFFDTCTQHLILECFSSYFSLSIVLSEIF